MARLGWEMDPKTRIRYDNAKEEGVIEHLSAQARRQEVEQIGHEEEGLKVLQALEAEGWMQVLFPAWSADKADEAGLTALHDLAVELLSQGVHADISAAQMRLLTAGLSGRELGNLKKQMLRPGFVEEWNSLDAQATGFAKVLLSKEKATPSVGYKLFTSYDPEAVLWLGFTSKDEAVKERFNLFLKVWPEVRQRIPHALLQEMRITAELPAYHEIVQNVFLELLDGKLSTPEEARAYLEPHSPPAPPPQVTIKRPRAKRGAEAKLKEDSFDGDEEAEETVDNVDDLDDIGGDDEELDLSLILPKGNLAIDLIGESEIAVGEDEDEDEDEDLKPAHEPVQAEKPATALAAPQPEKPGKPASASKPKIEAKSESKPAAAKAAPAQARKPAPPAKPAPRKLPAKAPAKPPVKAAAKPPAKKPPVKAPTKAPAPRSAPAKKKPVAAPGRGSAKANKPAVRKAAPKPAKKR
jgi:hypothetical protein